MLGEHKPSSGCKPARRLSALPEHARCFQVITAKGGIATHFSAVDRSLRSSTVFSVIPAFSAVFRRPAFSRAERRPFSSILGKERCDRVVQIRENALRVAWDRNMRCRLAAS